MTKLATKHVYYRGTKEKAFALQNERSKRLLEHYEISKEYEDTQEAYEVLFEKISSLSDDVRCKNKNNYLDLIFEIAYIEEALEVFKIKLNEEYDEMNNED